MPPAGSLPPRDGRRRTLAAIGYNFNLLAKWFAMLLPAWIRGLVEVEPWRPTSVSEPTAGHDIGGVDLQATVIPATAASPCG
jgi:hypothetical protein